MITKRPSGQKRPKRSSRPKGYVRNGRAKNLALPPWGEIAELKLAVSRLQQYSQNQDKAIMTLKESQARFLELFANCPLAYVVHDSNGFMQEINSAAKTLFALRPSETAHGSIVQFFPERGLLIWLNHIRRCSRTGQETASELSLRSRDGTIRQIQLVTVPEDSPVPRKPRWFHTMLVDKSEDRAAELALSQTELDYHRLIDMIEGIVWEADAHSLQFIYVSRYAERLLGYAISDWLSPGFWESHIFVEDRERVLNVVNRAVAKQSELRLDYRMSSADRQILWLHDCIKVVERNGILRLLGVAIDVTETRNAEQKMRQAHASLETKVAERTAELQKTVSELESFSYSLSHDMRAPIRAMRGYAELVEHMVGDKLGPKAPEFLRRIMSSAERLDLLVQDVLQFNRVSRAPLEMKSVPLDPLINNILHDYPALAPDKAQIEVRRPLLPIRGHEAFVGQALLNLLTNAVKFMPPQRTPRVRLWTEERRREGDPNSSPSGMTKKWVRIWVEDNGLGIAPDDQKRIFRMFERVHSTQEFDGTGIGLAIVQKAVERMGGQLGVKSSPGHGSKFWIELPPA